ncbi:MAG: hypothetical protein IPI38_19575 [Gemmatimonadetes bacterium]|nr:hypothetical protein [Gemmatimonadota bacterium]
MQHPDARWVDGSLQAAFTVPIDAQGAPGTLRFGAEAQARWGTETDPPEHTIGEIRTAVLLPDGGVGIVDPRSPALRVYDAAGRPRQVVGRRGQGPGEFRYPLSATVDRDGRLYVADANWRIEVFVLINGKYEYERTLTLELIAQDLCFLADTLVVQGLSLSRQTLIHIYDRAGRRVRSFGEFYHSPSPDMNEEFGLGRIACDEKRRLIYYAPRIGNGEVRAFRADGTLLWRTSFSGFRSNPWVSENRTLTTRLSRQGNHTLVTLAYVDGHGLLVQWTFRTWQQLEDEAQFGTTVSFLLNPGSGEPRALGASLPLVPAISAGRAVAIFEDPVPRFEVRALTRH